MDNQQDGGGGTAAIAALVIMALLIGIYFAARAGKKSGDGGGEDSSAAGPVTGGGLSQTQTQFIPSGANVDLNLNTPYTNNWAAVIDAIGSIFLDQLKDKLEDKLKADEDAKAKAADAEARANADAARAAADADAARAAAEADRVRAEADAARAAADKAQADADKARAAADKAQADATRAQVEAEKARAEGTATDAANKQVVDLDTADKAQADADAARTAADKAQADADAAAEKARADAAAADAAEKARVDANLKAALAAETVKAMAAEEEYARAVEDDNARKGDTRTGRSVAPEVRGAMAEKVRALEATARNGANAKALNDDFIDTARAEVDKVRVNIEAGTRAKTIANADQMDVDIARAETEAAAKARADADAKAQAEVRLRVRKVLDEEAKVAAEEKVRAKAEAVAERGRPQKSSLLEMEAKSRARGVLGSAETTRIVEMGEPNRDKTGLMEPETEDPEGRLRTHPLEYDGPRSSSWGKMPSEMMKRSKKYIRNVGAKIQRSMSKNPTTRLEADTKAMIDSKVMSRSAGKAAAKQAGMAAISIISNLDFASDLLMVVQIFCDAFFYGAFPDESTLITPVTVRGIQTKSVKAQIDSTTDYNKDVVDDINAGMEYKYARAQWPVIIGPLDEPSKHTLKNPVTVSPRYPEYENQQRVQAEIDAVREKLLRSTYKDYWISVFGANAYDEIVADPTDSLVNYVENTDFEITKSDELYREAYTSVCLYHGGVVYEDVRPAADPHWGGRPRFQCSWANMDLCETSANTWIDTNGRNGGNYGEWFTFDELNVSLSNITETPPSDKGIVGCHGTDTSTYRKACGIEPGHPLRKNGKTGACIISSPGVASICRSNKGTYVSAEHRCVFSEDYCQSIGTCFDRTEKMCYLPGEAMFAVSMVFGTGGPREWIKVNGCNFASTPEDGFYDIINVTPLGLFTKQGQTFMADMLANHENWNEGMKQTLGNPVMIAVIASMAVVFAMGTEAGGKAVGTALSKAGVDVSGEKGKKKVGKAQTAAGLLVMAVAIGIAIGAMTLESQEEQNKGPPDPTYGPYASEYTVGGWEKNIGTSPPLTLGFNDGWVTRPLKVHTLTGWPQTLSPSKKVPAPTYITENVQDIPTCDKSPRRFYSIYNLDGAWQSGFDMALAVKTYTQTHKPPVAKNLCYTDNKIRAGARATDNELFCMDPFPPATYADTLNIGTLAPDSTTDGTSRSYMTSRTWTDGIDPTTPQYPFDAVKDNSPELWYYQLVYDKHNMIGMVDGTDDGVSYKKGYPAALWNTELLQFYFLDSTIQEMRQYYCIQALIDVPDGSWNETASPPGVHPKCWGYLNVAVPGYKYTPMTLPGLPDTSAATQATLTATPPTDALPSSDPPTIARSISSPKMITVYRNYRSRVTISDYISIISLTPRAWVIGDTLTTDSAVSLGFDPSKGPVKIIGTTDVSTALISSEQTRAAGSIGNPEYIITRSGGSPNTSNWTNQSLINWYGSLRALLA